MDIPSLEKIAQLGAAVLAIVVLGGILYYLITKGTQELRELREERQKNQAWFMEFVNENNHQKEELITKHTEVMVETKESIKQNTETIKYLTEIVIQKIK